MTPLSSRVFCHLGFPGSKQIGRGQGMEKTGPEKMWDEVLWYMLGSLKHDDEQAVKRVWFIVLAS